MALIEIDWQPERGKLRGFGFAAVAAFPLLGLLLWLNGGLPFWDFAESAGTVWIVLTGIGLWCGAAALVAPVAALPIYWLLVAVGYPIGFVLSFVLMGLLFYGMLTPLGLFFRLIKRDALARKWRPEAESYWEDHSSPTDVSRYFKQF